MSILATFLLGMVAGAIVLSVVVLSFKTALQWIENEAEQAFMEGRYLTEDWELESLI